MVSYDLAPFFIEFLSLGNGYPPTSVFHKKKALQFFKPKVSLEEILATQSSYSKYQKYNINTQIIYHCLVDKTITIDDVDTLLSGDKQQFLIYLRINAFGEKLTIKLKCSSCEHTWDEDYNLIEISDAKKISFKDMVDYNIYEVVLPLSKHKVRYKHTTDLIAITPSNQETVTIINEIEATKNCLISINDKEEKEYLEKVFYTLRVKDSLFLREHIKETKPEIKIFYIVDCKSCGFSKTEEFFCNNYFFQIFPEDYDKLISESYFYLGYYFGMSWGEYLNIPIKTKYFLHERINKEIAAKHNDKGEAFDIPTKAPHDNTPEIRKLANKTKVFGSQNPKTQRFT